MTSTPENADADASADVAARADIKSNATSTSSNVSAAQISGITLVAPVDANIDGSLPRNHAEDDAILFLSTRPKGGNL
eukprot:CAMPEP_0171373642 /NCGR_PEP_ID=MMETSP0879-20121228/13113_1 /TAXON_ID=67004 /ORGANISM="Thalassiosira weissflogii, Strain CCMP1336" /LENGTH=77 /DNA_ID=CAMNT_0011882809 /DNA_START=25 /DNA_END=257 /DNA_ORIENTATION=+